MATELNDKTRVACNPLGIGRVVPGKCVAAALSAIGTGVTVEEYQKRMEKWVGTLSAKHLAYPGGGNAMTLLRFLVDKNKKAVVLTGKVKAVKAKTPSKPKAKKAKKEVPVVSAPGVE